MVVGKAGFLYIHYLIVRTFHFDITLLILRVIERKLKGLITNTL